MNERKARQWKHAQQKLATIPPCVCGYGFRETPGGGLSLTCHSQECASLYAMADLSRAGFCSQCGWRLRRLIGWDSRMGLIIRQSNCPHGHCHSLDWIRAEDATQAERDRLGLILVAAEPPQP